MIGRKWFEDRRACEEYLSWAIMRQKKTTRHIKLATHAVPRMLNGRLVLRTETYIHAYFDGHLTRRTLFELASHVGASSWMCCSPKIPRLCGHEDWASHLTNLITLKDDVKPTQCPPGQQTHPWHSPRCYTNETITKSRHGDESPIELCDLIHEQPCRNWTLRMPTSEDRKLESRRTFAPKLEHTYSGSVMGCRKCSTDFLRLSWRGAWPRLLPSTHHLEGFGWRWQGLVPSLESSH